jgi:hypothetical protein
MAANDSQAECAEHAFDAVVTHSVCKINLERDGTQLQI